MPKDKQNVYRAMLHGLMELSDEFLIPQVPTTDGNWLYDVFFQLRLDHPEIFWAVGFKYRYYKDSPNLILIPEYIFDKNKIREHQKALGARVDKLVRTAMKFSEWDKEKYVHDFICENIRYDKLKKPYSHEIIGPLGHGVGVCEGIAKSVKVLCDALGVWCIIAICGNNPKKGSNTVIPGTSSGSTDNTIIWMPPSIILWAKTKTAQPVSVTIILIWMTKTSSVTMNH